MPEASNSSHIIPYLTPKFKEEKEDYELSSDSCEDSDDDMASLDLGSFPIIRD